ncbi:hypothetical protein [Flavobacterium sp. 3HN19-14]|uniref:hypothetical protein n=1 Tax=Flavobacterium sp. 3HN19-14 TaxID=3448133 RepID=UPI003EDF6FDF
MRYRTDAASNNQFFRSSNSEPAESGENRIWLNITNTDNMFRQTLVGYVPEATNGYDSGFDGYNFTDNPLNISSIVNTQNMVIQGRALPFDVNDIVPLSVTIPTTGANTITIDHTDGLFSFRPGYLSSG